MVGLETVEALLRAWSDAADPQAADLIVNDVPVGFVD